MVRLVEEAIEVRVGAWRTAAEGGGPGSGAPEQFLWRGRLYRVTEIVDHWQERRPWWRAAAERPLAQVPLARQVWRVTASRGRCSEPGVYDLGADEELEDGCPGARGWLLLRTQD